MGSSWDVTDTEIQFQLNSIRQAWVGEGPWEMRLFQNPYEPGPGSAITDYVEADFDGYAPAVLDPDAFSSPVVADHIATTSQPDPCQFTADDPGSGAQVIYGYYVIDGDDNYIWGESFAVAKTVQPGDTLEVTARYRLRVYPTP